MRRTGAFHFGHPRDWAKSEGIGWHKGKRCELDTLRGVWRILPSTQELGPDASEELELRISDENKREETRLSKDVCSR